MCYDYALQIPAGHCPHDEAPAAVHWCLTEWIASVEEGRPVSLKEGEEAVISAEVCLYNYTVHDFLTAQLHSYR